MLARLNGLAMLLAGAMALATMASQAQAGDTAAGDPALGAKKFYTCYGCHGIPDYKNAYPDYSVPKLRHQTAAYIISALQEYKTGERPHPTMHAQAASLSDQDMEDIAAYLQGPQPIAPSATLVGTAPPQVAQCAACHGENGLGVSAPMTPKPPILAGQHVSYLTQALTTYHNGRRKNVVMNGMAALLVTPEDIAIAAAWFSSQPSPLATATTASK
jgi:cytochrome c553